MAAVERRVQAPEPTAVAQTACRTYDARFRRLLNSQSWDKLPAAVRRRFTKRVGPNSLVTYRGKVIETRHSMLGQLFAQLCRLIGAPLPLFHDADCPAVVVVSEDAPSGGQCWTRIYHRRTGFPQVIHSAKRFAGPTGLEEYLGRKLGMALRVRADDHGLVFTSDHYFIMVLKRRLRLPRWISPGRTTVRHRDLGEGRFAFDLELTHPVFGQMIHQQAVFRDE